MWPFKKSAPPAPAEPKAHFLAQMPFSTHAPIRADAVDEAERTIAKAQPRLAATTAMDDSSTGMPEFKGSRMSTVLPEALLGWFIGQGFIGYQVCALIAQNWLVDKAVSMPARDAVRHGYQVHIEGAAEDDDAQVQQIKKLDKRMRVKTNLEQFVKMGRLFGIRILIFRVDSPDPDYYAKPFNPDGVRPGSYRGMSQVDPYWCVPELDAQAVQDPASQYFYEPTWWVINGVRYHRSHLCIFRAAEVPDILKPVYRYGGIPVPQRIVERVYAAERTANEGPQLAMTKRLTVWKTDLAELYTNQEKAAQHMTVFTEFRDNYGVKLVDTDDAIEQHDTTLADLDATIMTQYQLVAAAAGVPATKLLGTTPKGFNSTGEYDEASYHEELETIQENDLTPVLDGHYLRLTRSEMPELAVTVAIDWAPVDSPTAKEYAEINKMKAETDNVLVQAGAIDGMDVRDRLKNDPNSEYTGIADIVEEPPVNGTPDPTTTDPDAQEVGGAEGRSDVLRDAPNASVAS